VEARIEEAVRKGEFDDLPGAGRPLVLDDDSMVPAELRVAWRILKNAGFVPPQVEALRDVRGLIASAVHEASTDEERRRASRRLVALTLVLEAGGVSLTGQGGLDYHPSLVERFS
jgi:hypothetical protein